MDQHHPFRHHFRLKRPCRDCPFRLVGAIELHPGRVEDILRSLSSGETTTFHCHATVYSRANLARMSSTDPDDEGQLETTNEEAHCAGAAAVLMKRGRPNLMMRFAFSYREASPEQWDGIKHLVID